MLINGKHWKTIWLNEDSVSVGVIDQTKLPHSLEIINLKTYLEVFNAIKHMVVRGAPLIGVSGAYGFALGVKNDPSDSALEEYFKTLNSARPTAVNLHWALKRIYTKTKKAKLNSRFMVAIGEANLIAEEDIEMCSSIGDHGLSLIDEIAQNKKLISNNSLNILTHCNAGWLATVDWGTALSPIYKAYRQGINLHVWVDETRPRNQGSSLTAFELKGEEIPHTVIVDNAGGYLMQNNQVDLVIVGSDRTTKCGDVCNKIGTYLKALAAKDCGIPFFVALPFSTIDWNISDGLNEINIESRGSGEVEKISGINNEGLMDTVKLIPEGTKCFNPSFDVTPSGLVTALITDKGVAEPNYKSLKSLYNQN